MNSPISSKDYPVGGIELSNCSESGHDYSYCDSGKKEEEFFIGEIVLDEA